MNIPKAFTPRFLARSRAAVLFAACGLATAGYSQSTIDDAFDGGSLDTSVWRLGRASLVGEALHLETPGGTPGVHQRAAIVSHAHEFNPFGRSLIVNLEGISFTAAPDAGTNNASSAVYAVIGRLPTDLGGEAAEGAPYNYSAGSSGYSHATEPDGGAFGINFLVYPTGATRLQVLDSGSDKFTAAQIGTSGTPTDVTWELDGANATWSVTIEGATFTNILAQALDVVISDDNTTVSGTFANFVESGIIVNDATVSRFVTGIYNGPAVTDPSIAEIDAVSVALGPDPMASVSTLEDDFEGDDLDPSTWTFATNASATATVSDSALTIDTAGVGSNVQALAVSAGYGFNPFDEALTIRLEDLDLQGTPGASTQALVSFAVIGRTVGDQGGPLTQSGVLDYAGSVSGGVPLGGGGGLHLALYHYSGDIPWRLRVYDFGGGVRTFADIHLNGKPTAITWTVNGATSEYVISIEGTTIRSPGSHTAPLNTVAIGSFVNMTEAGLQNSDGQIVSRVALGAYNTNTVIEAAKATWGAVSVAPYAAPPAPQPKTLIDDFEDPLYSSTLWAHGSAGNLGTADFTGGTLALSTNQNTAHARSALLSNAHDFNPFEEPLMISLDGISDLVASPTGDGSSSFYLVLGRHNNDTGGPAQSSLANHYSAGGSGYTAGSALGFALVEYPNGSIRIQILDSASGTFDQVQLTLDGVPTHIGWGIDGPKKRWTFKIEGASFTSVLVPGMGTVLSEGNTLASGNFARFKESTLMPGGAFVARLVLGVYNGSATTGSTAITLDGVSIAPYEGTPLTPSERAAAAAEFFGGVVVAGEYVNVDSMGILYAGLYPWVFSYNIHEARGGGSSGQGWLYVYGPDFDNAAWLYDDSLANWWFTVESVYPWVFVDGDDWVNLEAPVAVE